MEKDKQLGPTLCGTFDRSLVACSLNREIDKVIPSTQYRYYPQTNQINQPSKDQSTQNQKANPQPDWLEMCYKKQNNIYEKPNDKYNKYAINNHKQFGTTERDQEEQPQLIEQMAIEMIEKKDKDMNRLVFKYQPMTEQQCNRATMLIQKGCSIRNMVRDLQVSQTTARRIKKQYIDSGMIDARNGQLLSKPMPLWKQIEQTQTKNIMLDLLQENCALTLGGIKDALQKQGIKKQISTVQKYLKELRYSRKKLKKIPIQRNTKEKLVYRQKYCNMIAEIPLEHQIFLDETSFNQHTSMYFGWAPKGEEPSIHIPAHKKTNITLLAAISVRGFQAINIFRGPVTHKHVCDFLEHYLEHLQPHQVLILDNARVHHAATVRDKIAQMKRPVRFLPAYTPQLNPIQMVFGQIKSHYVKLRNHAELRLVEIEELIKDSIREMRTQNFKKHYQIYSYWIKRGQAGEVFQ